jgi:hypothetical protein
MAVAFGVTERRRHIFGNVQINPVLGCTFLVGAVLASDPCHFLRGPTGSDFITEEDRPIFDVTNLRFISLHAQLQLLFKE